MDQVEMLKEMALERAKADIGKLLSEEWKGIFEAYHKTLILQDDGGEVSFPVGISMRINPCADGVKITYCLAYSVKHRVAGEAAIVSTHPELFSRESRT